MAWTAPKTWVFEEVPSATTFNLEFRDNFSYLKDRADLTGSNITGCAISGSHVADDAIDDRTAGSRIGQFYRRQGGGADWETAGSDNFIPGKIYVQFGCIRWEGSAASVGTRAITFPVGFANNPLVFLTTQGANLILWLGATTTTAVEVSWKEISGGSRTQVDINWMAIGLE